MQRDLRTCIPAELQPLIGGFLSRRWDDIAGLETHLDRGDLAAVCGIAHKLKGNGTGYGFPAITEVGAEMELAAKVGDEERVSELVQEFKDLIQYFQRLHLI
jgi:HPt (histidine-containing phosphotransfer) domain-containing protein